MIFVGTCTVKINAIKRDLLMPQASWGFNVDYDSLDSETKHPHTPTNRRDKEDQNDTDHFVGDAKVKAGHPRGHVDPNTPQIASPKKRKNATSGDSAKKVRFLQENGSILCDERQIQNDNVTLRTVTEEAKAARERTPVSKIKPILKKESPLSFQGMTSQAAVPMKSDAAVEIHEEKRGYNELEDTASGLLAICAKVCCSWNMSK